jgi:hypothetical protein
MNRAANGAKRRERLFDPPQPLSPLRSVRGSVQGPAFGSTEASIPNCTVAPAAANNHIRDGDLNLERMRLAVELGFVWIKAKQVLRSQLVGNLL